MDNVHGTHSTTSIVKNPFLVLVDVLAGNLLVQLRDNVVHDSASVVPVCCNGTLREVMQVIRLEDVELFQTRVEEGVESREQGQEDRKEPERTHREARAGAAAGLRRGFTHGVCQIELISSINKRRDRKEEKRRRGEVKMKG